MKSSVQTKPQLNMVDLRGQYAKIREEVNTAIQEVIENTAFIHGPAVGGFEQALAKYLGVKHVIGCANGTDALQLALMALDLPAGSEVITPDFTFIATVEVVKLLGLRPVIVDVDPETFTIDPERIREAISNKTKAIVPVHLFGQAADMDAIMDIAREHNLHVVEDTAQAIGADFTFSDGRTAKAGTLGEFGCTSFFPSKNLGCFGDGGAVFTNDDALAKKVRQIANHGMASGYHYGTIGINSRLDTIQAAVLKVKLPHLDEYNQARAAAAAKYDEGLKDIKQLQVPVRNPDSTHTFHQYTLRVTDGNRDRLHNYLNEQGIPNKVYYPFPLHRQEPYQDARFDTKKLEVTKRLCQEVLSLPMHSELEDEQIATVVGTIQNFFNQQP